MTPANNINDFVARTREVVYLREVDRLLIIRPNKLQHLNETAFEMLESLYEKGRSATETVDMIAGKYSMERAEVERDMARLVGSISAIMNENYGSACAVTEIPFSPESIAYPVLSEIALTYRCQNRCEFCYAASPRRGADVPEMTTGEVKTIIRKIKEEAHVPTISFTGGEPTLREDLPELIAFARNLGMRTNLITNGLRCSDDAYVTALASAGLHSAQVSLESHDAAIHDEITGHPGAWLKTSVAVENLKAHGIYTHTNTTICTGNRNSLMPLVRYVKERYDAPYLSMNMIIRTGTARDNENVNISYSDIGDILAPVLDLCQILGIRFVWYSPTPYCIFNPVDRNLGSKSCACVSGLLSVSPSGDILPCSSFNRGLGSLLKHPFERIWNSDEALYWRERRYVPPACRGCGYEVLCGGGCPLYWEHRGCFDEIEKATGRAPVMRNLLWRAEHGLRVKAKGVSGLLSAGRNDSDGRS